jgi:GNAT superfamily N-acetyltransferase
MSGQLAIPKIREINHHLESEISLVAARMRQTLVEVLGEEKGSALYTMDWLVSRVKWHLDSTKTNAKVFLIKNADNEIVGHAIARIEGGEGQENYGYFSTVFIEPNSRDQRMASALIKHVEKWLRAMQMPKVVYNTAENHKKLIRLFDHHGYQITHKESEMVQLTKPL